MALHIIFGAEPVEGKNSLIEIVCNISKGTTGLLLCLTKTLFNTGKIVVLDSGFCVLQGLVELKKAGVYAVAVIKKRCYWPKYVPRDKIDETMKECKIGENKVMSGKLNNKKFHFYDERTLVCDEDDDYLQGFGYKL